nr:MAG TPA: hypothetical protein [Caudoviricetes sp.]
MGNFEIQDPPIFQTDITKWSRETNADGDEMGLDMEKVFNNTIYNKAQTEKNKKEIERNAALIEREKTVTTVTLMATGWQEKNGLYIQTVSVPGAEAGAEPILYSALDDDADAETRKTYKKAFGIVSGGTGVTGDGTVTFKVDKRPATDCTVGLRGV